MTAEGSVVVALVSDLMDRSRFGLLSRAGVDVRFVVSAAAVTEALVPTEPHQLPPDMPLEPPVVVVDLSRPDALEGIDAGAAAGARVVAYGSHVDRERLDAAHVAGAEVLARSAFFTRLPDLLSG